MNERNILKAIKNESLAEEELLGIEPKNKIIYLINKKIALQFHDLVVSIKMIFERR